MGESGKGPLRVVFDRRLKLEFHDSKDTNDAERLAVDPAMRHVVGGRAKERNAAFANPDVYRFLEQEGFLYAIRLPANRVLQRGIEHLLTRPVGRPPKNPIVWYESFSYRAASWEKPRRVVAKVEWHRGQPRGRKYGRVSGPRPEFTSAAASLGVK